MKRIIVILTLLVAVLACQKEPLEGGWRYKGIYFSSSDYLIPAHNQVLNYPYTLVETEIIVVSCGVEESGVKEIEVCDGIRLEPGQGFPYYTNAPEYTPKPYYLVQTLKLVIDPNISGNARKAKYRLEDKMVNAAEFTIVQDGMKPNI